MKCHVKKGDVVVVTSGTQKGKRGKILEVYPHRLRVIIEGVNLIKKATRKTQDRPQGGIIEREGTLSISNVMRAEVYDGSKKRAKATAAAA